MDTKHWEHWEIYIISAPHCIAKASANVSKPVNIIKYNKI